MLKDIINKDINVIIRKPDDEPFLYEMKGELEIIGSEGGEVFHRDKQRNKITLWAKHSTMHLLTGESFCQVGTTRLTGDSDFGVIGDSSVNNDGTMVSGEQYLANPTFPGSNLWWSRPAIGDSATHTNPYFPTKMLFGTGYEWGSWAGIGDSDYWSYYINTDGWTESDFDNATISNVANSYSANFVGDTLLRMRSMNDIYSATKTTPVITDSDYAIKGAVKNALYGSTAGDSTNIELVGGNYFPKKTHWGVGKPAFIYAKREARYYQSGAEVALNFDSTVENKITYTVTMPEQTSAYAGMYYPYNGFVLKEAGLFCDARFRLKNTSPPNDAGSDDSGLAEFDNYTSMPHGILFAKRYIAPITKSHSVSITARWSIYL